MPAPDYAAGAGHRYLAPRTACERLIAAVWTEVLGVARVGAEDDFFDLGGHSLLAARIAVRLSDVIGSEVPIHAHPAAPAWLRAADVVRAGAGWFMEQYAPGTAAYAIPIAVRLRGPFDVSALQRAIGGLISRHEALRMTFPATVDGRPEARVAEAAEVPLVVVAPPAGGTRQVYDVLRAAAAEPFDLATGPLLRALLTSLADDDHVLVLAGHHIVGDGWSSDVLVRELVELYRAAVTGRPAELAELPIQYGDFARWQREQLAAGLRPAPPVLDRAAGRRAPAEPAGRPAAPPRPALRRRNAPVRDRPAARHGPCRARPGPRRHLLHDPARRIPGPAGPALRPARLRGGYARRGRLRPEVENLVGMFVNMLALRVEMADDPCFAELLTRTRRVVLDGLRYQEMPFEQVVALSCMERDVARSPLFQATFALHNFEMNTGGSRSRSPAAGAGLTGTWEALNLPVTRFDLELQAVATDSEPRLHVYLQHGAVRTGHDRPAERFEVLLRAAVAEPSVPVSRLALLNTGERAVLTGTGTGTAVGAPA